MAKHKNSKKKKCFSGSQRWRPGSIIPIGFCDAPHWLPALRIAAEQWNSRFGYVTFSPVECHPRDTPGGIAIISQSIYAGGELHHGYTVPSTDSKGYIDRALIAVNTIDFYPIHDYPNGSSSIISHEGGHAIGAGHVFDANDGGCMQRPVIPSDPDYPGVVTLAYLNDIYSRSEICHK